MSENHSARGRLDSWKEIADYLKRDVRTAIRWGKDKGMPVHRVPGGKRQAVFAFKEEIDAWMVSQSPEYLAQPIETAAEASDPATLAATAGSKPEAVRRLEERAPAELAGQDSSAIRPAGFKKWRFGVTTAACVLLLFVAGRVFLSRSAAKESVGPWRIDKVTHDARAKGNVRTDGVTLYFNELEVSRQILVSTPVGGGPILQIRTPFANVDLQDVSNDGRRLLVTSFEGTEEERPLWIIPVQGGDADPVRDVLCSFARWSPDNRRIACAAGTTISLLQLDGSDRATLGPFPGVVFNLLWSPDGERLRFALRDQRTGTSTAWEIFAAKSDGPVTSATRLLWSHGWSGHWAWIHGGESFVYERLNTNGKPALYLRPGRDTSADTSQEIELPISVGTIGEISPGKNGAVLYILADQGDGGQLLKFQAKEKRLEEILPGLSADDLAFSRDGQWMTYKTQDFLLWRSRVDGSEALRLTSPPMNVEFSAWSPDGRQIAFMGQEPGKPWRVFLIGRDGGQAQEAAAGDDQQGAPTWSDDGKSLVYGNVVCREIQACWIRIMNLSTRQTEKLPGSHGFRTARWSPDGRYIAALHPETHELMMFDTRKRRWSVLADSITGDNLNWSSDSQFVYADSPQREKPAIERIRVSDGQRSTAMSLSFLQKAPGQIDFWFGLTPSNELLLNHLNTANEVYAVEWTGH
jgi:Tol biopolymer transport system component